MTIKKENGQPKTGQDQAIEEIPEQTATDPDSIRIKELTHEELETDPDIKTNTPIDTNTPKPAVPNGDPANLPIETETGPAEHTGFVDARRLQKELIQFQNDTDKESPIRIPETDTELPPRYEKLKNKLLELARDGVIDADINTINANLARMARGDAGTKDVIATLVGGKEELQKLLGEEYGQMRATQLVDEYDNPNAEEAEEINQAREIARQALSSPSYTAPEKTQISRPPTPAIVAQRTEASARGTIHASRTDNAPLKQTNARDTTTHNKGGVLRRLWGKITGRQ